MTRRTVLIAVAAILWLTPSVQADLTGRSERPTFSRSERELIDRNIALRSLIESDPWTVREFLDKLQASGNAELVKGLSETDVDANSENPDLDKLGRGSAEAAHDLLQLLKKAGAHEPAPPAAVDPRVLESYAGTYNADQIPLDIKVFVKDAKLYLQATGRPEFAPKPKSATIFEYPQYQLEVEFESAVSFILKQAGREFKFNKAAAR